MNERRKHQNNRRATETDSIGRRSEERRKRIVGHRAKSFKDAEQWDMEFWQKQTPEMRLSALVAIRNDILAVRGNDPDYNWDY